MEDNVFSATLTRSTTPIKKKIVTIGTTLCLCPIKLWGRDDKNSKVRKITVNGHVSRPCLDRKIYKGTASNEGQVWKWKFKILFLRPICKGQESPRTSHSLLYQLKHHCVLFSSHFCEYNRKVGIFASVLCLWRHKSIRSFYLYGNMF